MKIMAVNTTAAEVIIVGAGLTGLTLAKNLQDQDKSFIILEARDRIGGRIHTVLTDKGPKVELGATWFFPHFKNLFSLLKKIHVSLKEQYMKGNTLYDSGEGMKPRKIWSGGDNDMFRINGGTGNIVQTLYGSVGADHVRMGCPVVSVSHHDGDRVEVVTMDGTVYTAYTVVSTIPPQLLEASVTFSPPLPAQVTQVMRGTHTWMGDSVKAVVTYSRAWWKEEGLSGGLYSNEGPVVQMYDQSDDRGAALVGFLDDSSSRMSKEERERGVIGQLTRVFGNKAADYLEYRDTVWNQEQFTMPPPNIVSRLPGHANVGHSVYQREYWGGRLHIAGTETSSRDGGFMEGAVFSANTIANRLAD